MSIPQRGKSEPREPIRSQTWLYECAVCGCQELEGQPCPLQDDPEHHPNGEPAELERRHYIPIDALDRVLGAMDKHRDFHYPSGKAGHHADHELYETLERIRADYFLEGE